MAEGLLVEEGLFVLLVSDVFLHDILFHALGLLDVFSTSLQDGVHLGAQAHILSDGAPSALVLHLPENFLVHHTVERVALRIVRRVVEVRVLCDVQIDILCLDLEEEGVRVCVEELGAVPVLGLHLIVVEVVHEGFGEVQDAHPHVHRAIEDQSAVVHLDGREVIIKDVCLCEGWAGYPLQSKMNFTVVSDTATATQLRRAKN